MFNQKLSLCARNIGGAFYRAAVGNGLHGMCRRSE